jgi:Helix-turn-helix of DDE superfamily endonuclease
VAPRLSAGKQAPLVLAHLNKGETHSALADGFGVGTTTVFRYVREGVDVLAAVAPTLDQALDLARRKAFVILDGTLLAIDRVGMASGHNRAFYSGCEDRSAPPRSWV